jgi:hypothetical protein
MGGKALPYDAEIEYLESKKVASQVIDTGFVPDQDTVIEAVVLLPNFSMNVHFIYGAGTSLGSNCMEVYTWNDITMNVNGHKTLTSTDVPTNNFIKLYMSGTRIAIYDIDNNLINESLFSTRPFTCNTNLVIFGIRNGTLIGYDTIKSLKVRSENIDVFDFIPVRIGQVGYLYDKVSKQLFGQGDTSAYNLGPDKIGGGW